MKVVTCFDINCAPHRLFVKRFEVSLKGAHLLISIRLEMKSLDKSEFYDFLFFKKSIVLFTINTIHIKPTIPQTIESFKSANSPVYCIA